jgi:hypothetical protein
MFRRRARRPREIAFSLDSFLDLVANVVGIIIRLILVAWVGARSYKAVTAIPVPEHAAPTSAAQPPIDDTARLELDRNRKELEETQDRLLAQLRKLQELHRGNLETGKEISLTAARHQALEKEAGNLDRALKEQTKFTVAVAASLEDLRKRRQRLDEEIRALEKQPSAKKVLRYRTPVSHPVQTDEVHFECCAGRVAFIDVAAFLAEIKEWFHEKAQEPSFRWPSEGVTSPAGAFRARYVLEFETAPLNSFLGGTAERRPRGLAGWTVEPIAFERGEKLETALVPTSAFRQIVDALDPNTSVVTFWVYADSFPLYRRLRDYLYERGIEVAGRPLPIGHPIGFSRHGTVSRGQ